jgi:tripartite-type tricarboxylate transporter receptor subunit TctC
MIKRSVLLVLFFNFLFCSLAYAADKFPSRPITAVVPFGPGGGMDRAGRVTATLFEKYAGAPMRIVNMPGAGSAVGQRFVAEAAPDGYSIVMSSPAAVTMPYFYSKDELGWTSDDFAPVAIQQVNYFFVIVPIDSPFKTLNDMVEYGRANPGKIRYGTDGHGGTAHLGFKALELATGFVATQVPFDSGAELVANILGNHIDATVTTVGTALPLVRSGKIRGLAVSDTAGVPSDVKVPLAKDLGVDWTYGMFRGWMAPKDTPKERIAILAEGVRKTLEDPEVKAKIEQDGEIPKFIGPEEYTEILKDLHRVLKPVVSAVLEEEKVAQGEK